MDIALVAPICLGGFLLLMLLGVPVIYSLGFSSLAVAFIAYGGPSLEKAGWTTFSTLYNFNWTPLPLFVILACIIAETKIGEELFDTARSWLSRVPGGLIVASIFGEAALSAAVGTSGACIVAIGKVAEPELKKYGYDKAFAFGGICCGGVLGPLIPPSVGFIVYGVLAEVSIGHLLIAGVIPGIICAFMLSAPAIFMCARNPRLGPAIGGVKWSKRFSSLKKTWSIILVMVSMLGAMYLGIATPTEAAGVGVVATLIIAVIFYRLRLKGLYRALRETAILNGMVLFVMVGAWLFSYVIGSSGLAKNIVGYVASSGLSPWSVVIAINVLLLILGCFIDPITIMLLTIPLFAPVISHLGFDLVWFGVLYVVNMQIGLITPPMGLDLFFVRSAFNIPMGDLLRGVLPFLAMLIVFLVVLIAFPQLSLWLPGMMMGK
jgi:C4-dicarboxylate transporter DctM subunit